LPGILDALALKGLLEPVQGMVTKILDFLPNVFAAGITLGAGWLIAGIIQNIVTNLSSAMGADSLSKKVHLQKALGKQKLSSLLGMLVHIFIMLPVLIAALEALSIEALTNPVSNMLNAILLAIPNIFSAILVMGISYVLGKVVSDWLATILKAVGFDLVLSSLGLGKEPSEDAKSPSMIVGHLAMIAVLVFASIEAFNIMGLTILAGLMAEFIVFASQVALGIVILGIGLYLANLASDTILQTGTQNARFLSTVARAAILLITGAMALNRMGLANDIINIAFGLLLGSVAVAFAIAFGLGGRDVAAKMLEDAAKKHSG